MYDILKFFNIFKYHISLSIVTMQESFAIVIYNYHLLLDARAFTRGIVKSVVVFMNKNQRRLRLSRSAFVRLDSSFSHGKC